MIVHPDDEGSGSITDVEGETETLFDHVSYDPAIVKRCAASVVVARGIIEEDMWPRLKKIPKSPPAERILNRGGLSHIVESE